jgi:Domain of unknown function (DUF4389)
VAVLPSERPIRLVVRDPTLERSRLTVFFRVLLAIPVFVWLLLWGIAAFVVAFVLWLAILIQGEAPAMLHDFVAGYLRYWAHVSSYLLLAADPYPWFRAAREYPVDLEVDPPVRQSRWKTLFRLFLAVPALILAATLGGTPSEGGWQFGYRHAEHGGEWRAWGGIGGVAAVCAFFTWFVALARGRAPRGLRDLTGYALGYAAQATGYFLLLTDRYPSSDPALAQPFAELPEHPVRIEVRDELERSRLTVFFRLLLALPHILWFLLWSFAAFFAVVAAWLAALVTGRVPLALHRFIAAYVRYSAHLGAYLTLVGRRFPGFVGRGGSYGIDLQIAEAERQNRWKTLFRLFLAIPAFLVSGALSGALFVVAFLTWWYALVTGRMPEGLRNLGAACIRYSGQTNAYVALLTDRYPFASPVLEAGRQRGEEPPSDLPWDSF